MYLLLVPIGFAPFLMMYYPTLSKKLKLACIAVLLCVASYKSVNTWKHSSFYTSRLNVLNNFAEKTFGENCTKVAVNWNRLPPELDQWSSGMDLFIYSSAKGKGRIFSDSASVKKLQADRPADNDHFIIRLDEVMSARYDLNPVYFKLDSSAYCFVSL